MRCDCIKEEEDCQCGSGRQAGLKSDQVSLKDFLLVYIVVVLGQRKKLQSRLNFIYP